jgi:hypothetical protein
MHRRSTFSGMPTLKAKDEASEVPAIMYKLHAITLITQKVRPLLLRLCRLVTSVRKEKIYFNKMYTTLILNLYPVMCVKELRKNMENLSQDT